tara:strand:+ start:619 stop:1242 length:624 start_codon:yes stop_codon:yes gene_type:complete
MNVNSRKFKQLLLEKRLTQNELEKIIEIPRTRLGVWLSRNSIPTKYIDPLNKALGVDLVEYFKEEDIYIDALSENKKGSIPYYDVDILAGGVEIFNDNTIHEPSARYMLPDSNSDFILPVIGNSMSPNIDSGDKIAVKELIDNSVIFYGSVYVVITEDYRFVKVVKRHPEESKVILHSYNSEYDDIDLPKKKIIKMFTVQEVLKKIQ